MLLNLLIMAITFLQRLKASKCLCSQLFYLRKAAQFCVCLMRLMHHISILYVKVNSIILYKLWCFSIFVWFNCMSIIPLLSYSIINFSHCTKCDLIYLMSFKYVENAMPINVSFSLFHYYYIIFSCELSKLQYTFSNISVIDFLCTLLDTNPTLTSYKTQLLTTTCINKRGCFAKNLNNSIINTLVWPAYCCTLGECRWWYTPSLTVAAVGPNC